MPRVTNEKLLRLMRTAVVVTMFLKGLLKTDEEYRSVRRPTGVFMTHHTTGINIRGDHMTAKTFMDNVHAGGYFGRGNLSPSIPVKA